MLQRHLHRVPSPELRSLFESVHALMDNLPHNIYFKDKDSRFIRVNQAVAERMGAKDFEELISTYEQQIV